jgi:hypothetical protein
VKVLRHGRFFPYRLRAQLRRRRDGQLFALGEHADEASVPNQGDTVQFRRFKAFQSPERP